MASTLLWDVGNVVVRWNPRTLYSQVFEDPVECDRFLSSVCTMDWHTAHDRGVTFAENRVPLLARFPQYADQIHAWETRWWEMFSGTIPESESVIEALAVRGARQFGLTNMSRETFAGTIAMSPAFRHIEAFVVSGDEGLIKPDAAIYHLASQRAGLRPEQLLFVDDSAANIAAAADLGFHVHRFEDPAALRPALEAHGLL